MELTVADTSYVGSNTEYMTTTIDFVYESDMAGEIERYGSVFGIPVEQIEIVTEVGPAGGWPVVKFTGTVAQITDLLEDYEG